MPDSRLFLAVGGLFSVGALLILVGHRLRGPGVERRRSDWIKYGVYAAVINALTKDNTGIGYGGIGYGEGVRNLDIELEDGTIASPTEDSVRSGAYPLARPLYLYTNPRELDDCIRAFVVWILSPEGQQVVARTGFFAASDQDVSESLESLKGTR